jgi:transcriptional regulator
MYIPKLYQEEDREEILSFLRQNNFATLVSYDGERPIATHAPVDVVEAKNGSLTVYGHISSANPQRNTLSGQEILLIFRGPHTYISPRWYNHVNVPTWDYMIVHLYGNGRTVEGEELHALLSRLIQHHESGSTYRFEGLPPDFVENQIKGIIGFAVDITRVEAGYKLSQNRNDEDYWNIIQQLDHRTDDDSKKVASAMRARRKKTAD